MNRGNISVYNPSTNIHVHHINLNIVLDIWVFYYFCSKRSGVCYLLSKRKVR